MTQVVPPIYSPRPRTARVPVSGRLWALAVVVGCATLFGLALSISPVPEGVGTHAQLGLEPCQFLRRTGVPCLTCGMTTSIAWFVRGNWLASLYIQPMGWLLGVLAGMLFWAALYVALTGRAVHRLLRFVPTGYYLAVGLALVIVAWAWKIAIHLMGQDGWG